MDKDIILIDKSKGITSFDVIRRLRKKLGIKKMGHAGTLDPMATGLLIIGVESGTKKMKEFLGLPKIYNAEILLGVRTDTGDITGMIVENKIPPKLLKEDIEDVLKNFVGDLSLSVPIYSALKKEGRPLYYYARAKINIIPPVRVMKVSSAELLSYEKNILRVCFSVSSGVYIRSLAEELGRRLKTVATLQNLRRISIGKFSVNGAELI